MEEADFYSLPRLYDVLHTPGTADEVDGLERIARLFAPEGLKRGAGRGRGGIGAGGRRGAGSGRDRAPERGPVWLEPACGTGRYLRVLARRGYTAVGFDKSEEMVAYTIERGMGRGRAGKGAGGAGLRGGEIRAFVADMASFDRSMRGVRVDFAFNLINTIRHLDSDAEMLGHFRAMARVMTGGAVYAVGISLSAYGRESEDEDVWRARRGGTGVTQVVQYLPPTATRGKSSRVERVVSHLTVRMGRRTKDITSAYTLRTYDLRQWTGLIERSPLRLEAVVDEYGNEARAREPGYAVYLLKKR